jgi:hypothetical protein
MLTRVSDYADASDPTFCVSIYINKMQKLGSGYADVSDPTFCVSIYINKMQKLGSDYP